MGDSGNKSLADYFSLLDDEDDSDNDDANWKRKKSFSSTVSSPNAVKSVKDRCVLSDSGDSNFKQSVQLPVSRNINFDEEIVKQPIVRTITRTIDTIKSPSNVPSTSKDTSTSEPIWKRLSFPDVRAKRNLSQPSTSTQRVTLISVKTPPSLSADSDPSTPAVNRKTITPPSTSTSSDIRTRLNPSTSGSINQETPVQQRPPIPDNLDFKVPFAPPRPKYHSERDIDLNTFVKQIKAEMLFHQSLDRIYNRSIRELPAMKAIPELQSLVKRVIEGVLFDPEVQLNEDTVHKILKILDNFDLDNTSTWTFLIEQCYILVTKNTEAHYVRMAKFIEMSFNHLFAKKTRLLPATALSLFKLAQVRPFDPARKPSVRVKLETIKADLSGIN